MPVARWHNAIYGGVLAAILLAFSSGLAVQAWLQQNAETQAELASNAELGARALDSYFSKLEDSLRTLTEAITLSTDNNNDVDSRTFKVRAANLVNEFYRLQPDLANAVLVNRNGQIAVSPNLQPDGPPIFVAAGDSFKKFISRGRTGLDVGQPVYGQVAKTWIVPARYGVYDRHGTLIYFIGASLPVEFIASFWKDAPVVNKASLGAIRDDGFLLSRHPNSAGSSPEKLYGTLQTGALFDHLQQEHFPPKGFVNGLASSGGPASLTVFRRLPSYPVTFFVSMSKATLWALWWRNSAASLYMTFIMLIAVVVVATLFSRRQRAHALQITNIKNFLDTAIQNIPMPMAIKDANTKQFVLVNRSYERLMGVDRANILGATASDLFKENVAAKIEEFDREALDSPDQPIIGEFSLQTYAGEHRFLATTRIVVQDCEYKPQHLIELVDDITDRKIAEEKFELLAHYDVLTSLANGTLLRQRVEEFLARQRRMGTEFAVFLLDLDKFKAVNDALGHHAGDALLREVANRVKGSVREVDVAARLGGDEFALLVLPGRDTMQAGAEALAARLLDKIGAPYTIDGHQVLIGCSIGIALAPDHGGTSDELLKNADLALYRSKDSGRNCFHVYSAGFKAEADVRNEFENDLRLAIWREELELYYQPVVATRTGCMKAVEALVRWRHPKKGLMAPNSFIQLAEKTGLITQVGEWVLARACRDAMLMPESIRVSVNVSPVQFFRSSVLDTVKFALANSQLPPGRLELEITEGVLLKESELNIEMLRQLLDLGVSITLDDFGVGYSSLSYLTSFPFGKVKIDQSFVEKINKPEGKAVIASIVALSQTLNLVTCAEGVETEEQLAEVTALGIDLCQGYYFGKPSPLADLRFDSIYAGKEPRAA